MDDSNQLLFSTFARKKTAAEGLELAPVEKLLPSIPLRSISCGAFHYAAVSAPDGAVYTWGRGRLGLLGHGNEDNKEEPTKVQGMQGKFIKKVSCGLYHTAAVTDGGELLSWGWCYEDIGGMRESFTLNPQLSTIKNIRSVSCGYFFTAAIDGNGKLYTWGRGSNGCLGHGDTSDKPTPQAVSSFSSKTVLQLCSGRHFCMALTDEPSLYTWGHAANGQLGLGPNTQDQSVPTVVSALAGMAFTSMCCGDHHSAVVDRNGQVHTWGNGHYSRLGHPDSKDCWSPIAVAALQGKSITKVSAGIYHTVAIVRTGEVWTWGGYSTKYIAPHVLPAMELTVGAQDVACSGDHFLVYKGELVVDDQEKALISQAVAKSMVATEGLSSTAAKLEINSNLLAEVPLDADLAQVEQETNELKDQLDLALESQNDLRDELDQIQRQLQEAMDEQANLANQLPSSQQQMALGPYAHIPPEAIVLPGKGVSMVNEPSFALLNATEKYELKVLGFKMQYATTVAGQSFPEPLSKQERDQMIQIKNSAPLY